MDKNSKGLSKRTIRDMSILATIVIYSVMRFYIIAKGQLIGGAYFFSTYDFIMIFIISIPFAMMDTVSNYVRRRSENFMYRNSRNVVYYGLFFSVIYSTIIIVLILLFGKSICRYLLIGENCILSLYLFLPAVLLWPSSVVLKGYLLGVNSRNRLFISVLIEIAAMSLGTFLFSNVFTSYGKKVVAVLYDVKINSAFFAAGISLGIVTGVLIGFIFTLIQYITVSRQLIRQDQTKRLEDIYDLGSKIVSEVLVVGFSSSFILLFNFVNQVIFLKFYDEAGQSLMLYNIGSYYSAFWTIIICPSLFTIVYSFWDRKSLRAGYKEKNKNEIRLKIAGMTRLMMIYCLPICVFICIFADYISLLVFGLISQMTIRLIRIGCFAIIFYGLYIIYMNVLICIKQTFASIISGLAGLIVDIFILIFALNKTELGIYSLMIAFYGFAIVSALIGLIFLMRKIKYRPKLLITLVRPAIAGIVVIIIGFLSRLLFGLFAPVPVNLLISGFLCILGVFIIYAKIGAISYSSLSRSIVGNVLIPVGKLLRIFK